MSREERIQRFSFAERIMHWIVGLTFVYVMLSGLALFSPHLYWLAYLLGGGTTIVRWHPIVGLLFFIALIWMFATWLRDMKIDREDVDWIKRVGQYIRHHEGDLPDAGRFNAGQKGLFWVQGVTGVLLVASGIPLWFPHHFPQWSRLVSILVHEIAALAAIGAFIVHIYMGTAVVRGSLSAMITGTVSAAWARFHHPRWYRKVESEKVSE
ncbi:MAG TPA: formate dehydrogenase subunit gamma [Acidobacteriota bacterium]|nr:formate dehydrogenase subunit gamma [Acidobacteriota bacterium]